MQSLFWHIKICENDHAGSMQSKTTVNNVSVLIIDFMVRSILEKDMLRHMEEGVMMVRLASHMERYNKYKLNDEENCDESRLKK